MWKHTICAILYPILCISKIPSAFISQRIQWTITEQTVKIIRICILMAWKILAFFMAEIRILFSLPIRFLHFFFLLSHNIKKYSNESSITLRITKYQKFITAFLKLRNYKRERCYPGVEKNPFMSARRERINPKQYRLPFNHV